MGSPRPLRISSETSARISWISLDSSSTSQRVADRRTRIIKPWFPQSIDLCFLLYFPLISFVKTCWGYSLACEVSSLIWPVFEVRVPMSPAGFFRPLTPPFFFTWLPRWPRVVIVINPRAGFGTHLLLFLAMLQVTLVGGFWEVRVIRTTDLFQCVCHCYDFRRCCKSRRSLVLERQSTAGTPVPPQWSIS